MRVEGISTHVYDCFSTEVTDVAVLPDPHNYKNTIKPPESSEWTEAIESELQQIVRIKVFNKPVLLPEGDQLVGTRLILKMTRDADGEIEYYETPAVAQGLLQILFYYFSLV